MSSDVDLDIAYYLLNDLMNNQYSQETINIMIQCIEKCLHDTDIRDFNRGLV